MSNAITVGDALLLGAQPSISQAEMNSIFMFLHGCYGNMFLSKFSTGTTDAAGQDQGMENARRTWGSALSRFDGAAIKAALLECQTRHPDFPPNLPQFLALCSASTPRQAYQASASHIEMDLEIRRRYARAARAAIGPPMKDKSPSGGQILEPGLGPLMQSIAEAVAAGGGDEAAALVRMEKWLAPIKSQGADPPGCDPERNEVNDCN